MVKFQNHAQKATPTTLLYNLLDNIISDPLNTLVIISGARKKAYRLGLTVGLTIWLPNMAFGQISQISTGHIKKDWHFIGCPK
nr:hypothetical protein [Sphingobacterium multivorum]